MRQRRRQRRLRLRLNRQPTTDLLPWPACCGSILVASLLLQPGNLAAAQRPDPRSLGVSSPIAIAEPLPAPDTRDLHDKAGLTAALPAATEVAAEATPAAANIRSSREINLPAYQLSALQRDLPATAMALDGEERVWIAGQRHIWRWELHSQRLSSVSLQPASPAAGKPLNISHLVVQGDQVFAATASQLFQVSGEPLRAFQYQAPSSSSSSSEDDATLGLSYAQATIFWQRPRGIYQLDPATQELRLWRRHARLPSASQSLLLADQQRLWFTIDNRLYLLDLTAANLKPHLQYETRYAFTGLARHHADLLVHTRHTVLQFGRDGDLIRTIPVEGERRLVHMSLSPRLHTFLFHDRILERHAIGQKKTFHSYLDIGRVHKAASLVSASSLVAMILDGTPRVFQLEGEW